MKNLIDHINEGFEHSAEMLIVNEAVNMKSLTIDASAWCKLMTGRLTKAFIKDSSSRGFWLKINFAEKFNSFFKAKDFGKLSNKQVIDFMTAVSYASSKANGFAINLSLLSKDVATIYNWMLEINAELAELDPDLASYNKGEFFSGTAWGAVSSLDRKLYQLVSGCREELKKEISDLLESSGFGGEFYITILANNPRPFPHINSNGEVAVLPIFVDLGSRGADIKKLSELVTKNFGNMCKFVSHSSKEAELVFDAIKL